MNYTSKLTIGFLTITFLMITFVSSSIAQSSSINPTEDPRYKDPGTAQLWGIIFTGGGHFYAGESTTGAILLGTGIGAPIIGYAISEKCTGLNFSCEPNLTPMWLGVAAGLGAWIYSIADAPKAARRTNVKNGLVWNSTVQLSPDLLATKTNKWGYGLKMSISF